MLKIRINSEIIDLPEDISIQITSTNPMFTENGFNEAFSYSFNIPLSGKNLSIFNKYNSTDVSISLEFSSHLLLDGFAQITRNNKILKVSFKSEATDLRQYLESISFSDVELDVIPVCDLTDPVLTKIDKWHDHMTDITFTEIETEGTHKFPMIYPAIEESDASLNFMHYYYSFSINTIINGTFIKNEGVPKSYRNGDLNWRQTVSPCIRLQYLFEKVLEYVSQEYGILIVKNEIIDIIEWKQMISFSTKVFDELYDDGTNRFNFHGHEIDLNQIVPDASIISIFKLIFELFGINFYLSNRKLNILISDNQLKKNPIDLSKYCVPQYNIDYTVKEVKKLSYELSDLDNYKYLIRNLSFGIPGEPFWHEVNKHSSRIIGKNTKKVSEEVVSYTPLVSSFGLTVTNHYITIPNFIAGTPLTTFFEYETNFKIPLRLKSKVYDEKDFKANETFLIGCLRGKFDTYKPTSEFQDPTLYPTVERMFFYNGNRLTMDDSVPMLDYNFGSCSLYFNDHKSHVSEYLKRIIPLKSANEVSKTLYLPAHKIFEILKWDNPNHIIKQRNLSFKGAVKKVNFTLYKNSISPVEITYAVVEKEKSGDFNDDFNDDYLV